MHTITRKQGNLLIVSAPSGAGKTSLVNALIKSISDLGVSVSHTTRPARPNERDGVDYHFVESSGFQSLIEQGQFLEHARVFDHDYGTSRHSVEHALSAGKDLVLEIDWQGARQISREIPEVIKVFILPPSLDVLESRLTGRGDESASIHERMQRARNEISHYHEYDYVVINDHFNTTLEELKAIILAARHGYSRQKDYFDTFVRQLLNDGAN